MEIPAKKGFFAALQDFELHRKGKAIKKKRLDQLVALQEDNDLESVPDWLEAMLNDVMKRKTGGRIFFHSWSSEVSSFLTEVAELLNWDIDDYGTDMKIEFSELDLQVSISRVAQDAEGKSSCSYEVTAIG